ncbi:hypothetical protein V6N13_004630 [Hibiscus sabdariffa]
MQRRRQNIITALKDDNCVWCSDVEVLKSKAVNFYTQLFTSMGSEIEDYAVQGDFWPLPNVTVADLKRPVTVEEIEHVFRRNLGPLVNWIADPSLLAEPARISSLVNTDGGWKWEELDVVLPESVLHMLAMKLPLGDSGCDMPGWKWSETRQFSVRSTYAMGAEQTVPSVDSIWSCTSMFKGESISAWLLHE